MRIYDRRKFVSVTLPFAALALTLGALFAMHSWDYPTFLFIAVAAIAVALLARQTSGKTTIIVTLMAAVLLIGVSLVLFAPYHTANATFYTEIVASNEQTPIRSLLAIFGLPLLIIIVSLRPAASVALGIPRAGLRELLRGFRSRVWPTEDTGIAFLTRFVGVIGGIILAAGVLALFLMGFGNRSNHHRAGNNHTRPHILRASPSPRAFVVWRGISRLWPHRHRGYPRHPGPPGPNEHHLSRSTCKRGCCSESRRRSCSGGCSAPAARSERSASAESTESPSTQCWPSLFSASLSTLSSAQKPASPTASTRTIPLTLDGSAYMQDGTYIDVDDTEIILRHELDALLWLRENATGLPVVAEAGLPAVQNDTPYYRIQSRAALYAGLPMIVGWPWHQRQQRGIGIAEPEIDRRQADVRSLYSSGSPTVIQRILDEYDVGYVLVGQTERAYYFEETVAVLERHPRLSLAYENEAVRVYVVLES